MVKSRRIKVVAVSPSNIVTSDYLTNDSTVLGFDWSLKPITTWLQIFGIQPPLISSVNRNSYCNRFVSLIPIAAVFYFLNVGCHGFALGQMKWNVIKKNYIAVLPGTGIQSLTKWILFFWLWRHIPLFYSSAISWLGRVWRKCSGDWNSATSLTVATIKNSGASLPLGLASCWS